MSWRVDYKALSSTNVEHIVVDTRAPWDALETVRSAKAADGGHIIFVKAGKRQATIPDQPLTRRRSRELAP